MILAHKSFWSCPAYQRLRTRAAARRHFSNGHRRPTERMNQLLTTFIFPMPAHLFRERTSKCGAEISFLDTKDKLA